MTSENSGRKKCKGELKKQHRCCCSWPFFVWCPRLDTQWPPRMVADMICCTFVLSARTWLAICFLIINIIVYQFVFLSFQFNNLSVVYPSCHWVYFLWKYSAPHLKDHCLCHCHYCYRCHCHCHCCNCHCYCSHCCHCCHCLVVIVIVGMVLLSLSRCHCHCCHCHCCHCHCCHCHCHCCHCCHCLVVIVSLSLSLLSLSRCHCLVVIFSLSLSRCHCLVVIVLLSLSLSLLSLSLLPLSLLSLSSV